jgi:uncharacterized repeat protein (TIGR03803 family)
VRRPHGSLTLHNFCSDTEGLTCLDGKTPDWRLLDVSGELYGTASTGGSKLLGTVFRVSTSGGFTLLHAFCRRRTVPTDRGPATAWPEGPSVQSTVLQQAAARRMAAPSSRCQQGACSPRSTSSAVRRGARTASIPYRCCSTARAHPHRHYRGRWPLWRWNCIHDNRWQGPGDS